MFIAITQNQNTAPAEPDVAAARIHSAPLERRSRVSNNYKHLVPPGPKANVQVTLLPQPTLIRIMEAALPPLGTRLWRTRRGCYRNEGTLADVCFSPFGRHSRLTSGFEHC